MLTMKGCINYIIISIYLLSLILLSSCIFYHRIMLVNLEHENIRVKIYQIRNPIYVKSNISNKHNIDEKIITLVNNINIDKFSSDNSSIVESLGHVYLFEVYNNADKLIFKYIYDYHKLKNDNFRVYIYDMNLNKR